MNASSPTSLNPQARGPAAATIHVRGVGSIQAVLATRSSVNSCATENGRRAAAEQKYFRNEVFIFRMNSLFSYMKLSPLWTTAATSLSRGRGVFMRINVAVAVACLSMTGLSMADQAQAAVRRSTNIAAQGLAPALRLLARERDIQVVYRSDLVGGRETSGAVGEFTVEEALTKLLSGTGLTFQYLEDNGITIVPISTDSPRSSSSLAGSGKGEGSKKSLWDRFRVAQVDQVDQGKTASDGVEKSAGAPDSNEGVRLEEIVVTAQKRKERLQDVPVPVTTISSDVLVRTNELRLRDFAVRIPGLTVVPYAGGRAQAVSIRGLYSGATPAVAYVIDEVPFGANTSIAGSESVPDLDPGDLASIEVLRGPQGTLYGASSLGGLIKFVTVDPLTTGYSGRLSVGTTSVAEGDKMGYNVRGSLNVPVSETLAFGLSGYSRREPGYIDLMLGDEGVNQERANGGRLSLMWRPASDWALKLNAFLQEKEVDGGAWVVPALGKFVQNTASGADSQDVKFQAYSATLTGKMGRAGLTSITGYNKLQPDATRDVSFVRQLFGPSGAAPFGTFQFDDRDIEKFTQELRITIPVIERVDAMVGAFYTESQSISSFNIIGVDSSGARVENGYEYLEINDVTFAEKAIFANLTVQITDRLDVQVGGRQSWMKQSNWSRIVSATALGAGATPATPISTVGRTDSADPDAFTFLLTPRFKVSPDLMVYARVASGYRVGGSNDSTNCKGTATTAAFPCAFDPDTSTNYELGVKGDFLGHALSVDASIYYIDWDQVQLRLFVPPGFGYTTNAGKARSQGVELSMEVRPRHGLTLAGWVAWNDAELTEDSSLGQKGDRLQYGTDWTGRLSASQSFPLPGNLTGFAEASGNYVGARESGVGSTRTGGINNFPAYTKYDFSAGVRTPSGWSASLFVTNVTDERGTWQGNPELPGQVIYIQPRTIGMNLSREF